METITYQTVTKATKEHVCNFCAEKIIKGQSYYKSTHKQDGEIYDWKTHLNCGDIASKLNMYNDRDEGVNQDDFIEDICEAHMNLMIAFFNDDDIKKYSDVIQQLNKVQFRHKLAYVVRHYLPKACCHPPQDV